MADTAAVVDTPPVIEDRKAAIAAALETHGGELVQVEEVEVKEEVKEDKKAEPAQAVEPSDAEKEARVTAQAKELFAALNDPAKAPLVIDFLARQAGYTKGEIAKAATTKVDAAVMAEDAVSILKSSLGPEFEFLADKFAPAIEKILSKKVEESQKDIREEFKRQEAEKLQQQSSAAINALAEDFFGKGEELPDAVSKEMSKYMDRIQPGPNTTIREYVEDAFNASIGKLGLQKADKAKQERTTRNRSDAASRLASERVPAEENLRRDSKPMTRLEAIKAAVEAAERGQ